MSRRTCSVALITLVAGAATAGPALAKGEAESESETLRATMKGTTEVPKGDSDGTGTARLTVNTTKGSVCYSITLKKVGSVAMGHIHKGAKGAAGAVVVPLFDKATRKPKGCATGVKKSLLRAIVKNPGSYYVNVHNAKHPAGAVRGQLHG